MVAIAFLGDDTTTTSLAVAAGWPITRDAPDVVLIEADGSGGSLAAWLDIPLTPSLSSLVTALHREATSTNRPVEWASIDDLVRRAPSGVRVVPAPFRAREARTAVEEADRRLWPIVARTDRVIALLDAGRVDPSSHSAALRHAAFAVICHRQHPASPAAASARIERLAETVESVANTVPAHGVAIIGSEPFDAAEIADHVAPGQPRWDIALDPLAAAVFAGRSGVSTRRLARLPLVRSASRLADDLDGLIRGGSEPGHTDAAFAADAAVVQSTERTGA